MLFVFDPNNPRFVLSEASKDGMKVGRIKDPLYKDLYSGITPPTFIPPSEAPEFGGFGAVLVCFRFFFWGGGRLEVVGFRYAGGFEVYGFRCFGFVF